MLDASSWDGLESEIDTVKHDINDEKSAVVEWFEYALDDFWVINKKETVHQ